MRRDFFVVEPNPKKETLIIYHPRKKNRTFVRNRLRYKRISDNYYVQKNKNIAFAT